MLAARAVLCLLHLPAEITDPFGETSITADDTTSRADFRPLLGRKIIKEDMEIPLTAVCGPDRYVTEGQTIVEVVWRPMALLGRGRKDHCAHHA